MEQAASKEQEQKQESLFLRRLRALPKSILSLLDWLVDVAERLVVLAIACVVFYTGWLALSGASSIWILSVLSENWKALLLLLIPMFYRTIRSFIDRMEEGPFGTKAPHQKTVDPAKGE
jgi:hypothetical protein